MKSEIVQIISTHKKIRKIQKDGNPTTPLRRGYKRVMAILRYKGGLYTRHIDIPV